MIARFDDLVVTPWNARFQGRNFPVAIGRSGIGIKRGEGDGVTPVGCFNICHVMHREDRVAFSSPAIAQSGIGLFDKWSDDPKDAKYNQHVRAASYGFSHESLRRADALYDAFGILDFNWPDAVAGKGSAIFIHAWRKPRHPTEGCIAFAPEHLLNIFENWTNRSKVIIRP